MVHGPTPECMAGPLFSWLRRFGGTIKSEKEKPPGRAIQSRSTGCFGSHPGALDVTPPTSQVSAPQATCDCWMFRWPKRPEPGQGVRSPGTLPEYPSSHTQLEMSVITSRYTMLHLFLRLMLLPKGRFQNLATSWQCAAQRNETRTYWFEFLEVS